jgi:hypothetical protein
VSIFTDTLRELDGRATPAPLDGVYSETLGENVSEDDAALFAYLRNHASKIAALADASDRGLLAGCVGCGGGGVRHDVWGEEPDWTCRVCGPIRAALRSLEDPS